jgi:hypothetical protein
MLSQCIGLVAISYDLARGFYHAKMLNRFSSTSQEWRSGAGMLKSTKPYTALTIRKEHDQDRMPVACLHQIPAQ